MKIITSYFRVPGPAPECDWSARYEEMEESSPVGYGLTEQDAIIDLTMNYDVPGALEITPAGLAAMAEYEQAPSLEGQLRTVHREIGAT